MVDGQDVDDFVPSYDFEIEAGTFLLYGLDDAGYQWAIGYKHRIGPQNRISASFTFGDLTGRDHFHVESTYRMVDLGYERVWFDKKFYLGTSLSLFYTWNSHTSEYTNYLQTTYTRGLGVGPVVDLGFRLSKVLYIKTSLGLGMARFNYSYERSDGSDARGPRNTWEGWGMRMFGLRIGVRL